MRGETSSLGVARKLLTLSINERSNFDGVSFVLRLLDIIILLILIDLICEYRSLNYLFFF